MSTEQLRNSFEDEDLKRVVEEHEADDERIEEIMASARGKASKIREEQKRRKKMARIELRIPTPLFDAIVKDRKLDKQKKRNAESIPDDMLELFSDSIGQLSFLKPQHGETASQAAAREVLAQAQEAHEAEQSEGQAALDELAAGAVH